MSELERAVAAARQEKERTERAAAEYRADALRRLVEAKQEFLAQAPRPDRLAALGTSYDGRAAYNISGLWLLPDGQWAAKGGGLDSTDPVSVRFLTDQDVLNDPLYSVDKIIAGFVKILIR
jgi:hypothetical protein